MYKVPVVLLVAVLSFSNLHAADTYKVDPVHSSVIFKIKHMGVSNCFGRFNSVNGTINLDEKDPKSCSVEIEVKADSVDTNEPKRDQHVKGADFLDVKQFANITFKSTGVEKGEGDAYVVSGDFTLHGTTKPVKITMTKTGAANGKIGFEGQFTIKRSDYGMNFMPQALGDEILLMVGVEAGQPKPEK
jgi:polyisoprenoid-binding protein YceI